MLAQRQQNKAQGQGLNELGSFQSSSLEKIQAKASKLNSGSSTEEQLGIIKSSLPQAANNFRAKLLRSHDIAQNNSKNSSTNTISNKTIRDEPQIIQNALNSLKKNLLSKEKEGTLSSDNKNKNDQQKMIKQNYRTLKAMEEAKRLEEEKNLGPDDIVEYRGMKMTMSQREEYMEMEEEQIIRFRQNYYPAKYASKKNGVVVTYAANTHQGMVRGYNEDRVSIILNIIKPKFKQIDFWPRCSFFAIYDGHGGAQCADFLRDQLHQMIVRDSEFPQNPIKAMQRGFEQAEKSFLDFAHHESNSEAGNIQRSGSCAIVVLIVGDVAYIANVGDSRAFMSADEGRNIIQLSEDHKPETKSEQDRIESNGGKVYQNQSFIPDPSPGNHTGTQTLIGPHRVFPGRLSVSRTIGDIEAKDERYGGNPNVVIAVPEIRAFKIKESYDFIVIGCDGVFEKLENQAVMDQIWDAALQPEDLKNPMTMHSRCGTSVDGVLSECVNQKTLDNITCVVIGFQNFEKLIEKARTTGARNYLIRDANTMAEEIQLDWETELTAIAEYDPNNVFSKLAKPLEPVEEEMMENSELETPLSEVIEVTRKKALSRGAQGRNEAESHTSSVSEKYADSSRRQSQLLETQDTQNLIDHELANFSGVNSMKQLRNNPIAVSAEIMDQAQSNAPIEDQQAGKEQLKSSTQIGLGDLQNNHSEAQLPSVSSSEQGLTNKAALHGSQKEYKIRQTSVSPARVQRQNSDRTIRRQRTTDQQIQQRNSQEPYSNPLTNQFIQAANNNSSIVVPSTGSCNTGQSNMIPRNSTTIPIQRTAKTPINPNGIKTNSHIGTRNNQESKALLESSNSACSQQKSQTLNANGRPITPRRIIVQQKDPQKQFNHNRVEKEERKSTTELPSKSAGPDINSGSISTDKTTRNSARRKEDKRREEATHGKKMTKKMAQNWIDSAVPGNGADFNQTHISHGPSANISSSFQSQGAPSSSKAINNLAKNYLSNMSNVSSRQVVIGQNNASRSKNQRVNDIKNMISHTHNNIGQAANHSTTMQDLLKEYPSSDLQGQFKSFNGHQLGKQGLIEQQTQQKPSSNPQKSSSNPPITRQRKTSSGKASLGNAAVRQVCMNNTQQLNMRSGEIGGEQPSANFHHLPITSHSTFKQQQQRSSASRNKPSNLNPVSNSNTYPVGQQNQPDQSIKTKKYVRSLNLAPAQSLQLTNGSNNTKI